jgi:hypothetical protein
MVIASEERIEIPKIYQVKISNKEIKAQLFQSVNYITLIEEVKSQILSNNQYLNNLPHEVQEEIFAEVKQAFEFSQIQKGN